MDAVEFVKEFGVEEAIRVVELHPVSTLINIDGSCVSVSDLKQIVDAWELVESYGGIESCKNKLYMLHELAENPEPIRDAINLVEQCGV